MIEAGARARAVLAAGALAALWACGGSGSGGEEGPDGGRPREADAGSEPEVSFTADVQPILDARCVSCHFVATPGGLVPAPPPLVPAQSYDRLLIGRLSCNPALPLVVPGAPGESELLRLMTDQPACGAPMPQNTNGLRSFAPAEYRAIERWIEQGAPRN